jgi:hypothetical protein
MSPIYDFSCKCGNRLEDEWAGIEEKTKPCPCGSTFNREVGAPRINMGPVPTGGYYDETLESHVETKTQWERLCREKNVMPKGDTPKVER